MLGLFTSDQHEQWRILFKILSLQMVTIFSCVLLRKRLLVTKNMNRWVVKCIYTLELSFLCFFESIFYSIAELPTFLVLLLINGMLYYIIESEIDDKGVSRTEGASECLSCCKEMGDNACISADEYQPCPGNCFQRRIIDSLIACVMSALAIPVLQYLCYLFLQPELAYEDLSCTVKCEDAKQNSFWLTFCLEFVWTALLELYLLKNNDLPRIPSPSLTSFIRMASLSMLFFFDLHTEDLNLTPNTRIMSIFACDYDVMVNQLIKHSLAPFLAFVSVCLWHQREANLYECGDMNFNMDNNKISGHYVHDQERITPSDYKDSCDSDMNRKVYYRRTGKEVVPHTINHDARNRYSDGRSQRRYRKNERYSNKDMKHSQVNAYAIRKNSQEPNGLYRKTHTSGVSRDYAHLTSEPENIQRNNIKNRHVVINRPVRKFRSRSIVTSSEDNFSSSVERKTSGREFEKERARMNNINYKEPIGIYRRPCRDKGSYDMNGRGAIRKNYTENYRFRPIMPKEREHVIDDYTSKSQYNTYCQGKGRNMIVRPKPNKYFHYNNYPKQKNVEAMPHPPYKRDHEQYHMDKSRNTIPYQTSKYNYNREKHQNFMDYSNFKNGYNNYYNEKNPRDIAQQNSETNYENYYSAKGQTGIFYPTSLQGSYIKKEIVAHPVQGVMPFVGNNEFNEFKTLAPNAPYLAEADRYGRERVNNNRVSLVDQQRLEQQYRNIVNNKYPPEIDRYAYKKHYNHGMNGDDQRGYSNADERSRRRMETSNNYEESKRGKMGYERSYNLSKNDGHYDKYDNYEIDPHSSNYSYIIGNAKKSSSKQSMAKGSSSQLMGKGASSHTIKGSSKKGTSSHSMAKGASSHTTKGTSKKGLSSPSVKQASSSKMKKKAIMKKASSANKTADSKHHVKYASETDNSKGSKKKVTDFSSKSSFGGSLSNYSHSTDKQTASCSCCMCNDCVTNDNNDMFVSTLKQHNLTISSCCNNEPCCCPSCTRTAMCG